jgi:parallel beta-helix repeat protein
MAILLVLVLVASSASFSPNVQAQNRTIVVPDHYSTIEAATANANNGDTIFIREGTYEGSPNQTLMINKAITLHGEDENTTIMNLSPPLVQKNIFTFYYMDYLSTIQINSDNVKITGLTINTPGGAISAVGNEIQIVGITATTGISIAGSGTIISGNTLRGDLSADGNNNTIANNLFKTGVVPPYFHLVGSNNVIINNMLTSVNETSNIKLDIEGSNNVIANNLLSAISLKSENNIVYKNSMEVLPGDCGVYLSHSSGNTICANRITFAESLTYEQEGIFLSESYDNVVYANNIESVFKGAYMQDAAYNNTFYHNNFINNQIQAWDTTSSTTNTFDNGKEGNYWSSYNGTDANNDGIGDTPYYPTFLYIYDQVRKVTECSPDNYPLMAPFDIDSVSVELPEWANISPSLLPSPSPSSTPSREPTPTPETQQTESFLTVPVAAASATIVIAAGLGLLVYLKKHGREAEKHES